MAKSQYQLIEIIDSFNEEYQMEDVTKEYRNTLGSSYKRLSVDKELKVSKLTAAEDYIISMKYDLGYKKIMAKTQTKYLCVRIIAVTAEEIPSTSSAPCSKTSPFSLCIAKDFIGSINLTSPFNSPESPSYISLIYTFPYLSHEKQAN